MSNMVVNSGAYRVLGGATGAILFLSDTMKAMLCSSTYTQNKDDEFIDTGGASDPVDARIAGTTDQTLTSKAMGKDLTGDFAYVDGDDPTFAAVAAGTVAKLVIYKDTGTPTTSPIFCVLDVAVVANGGDITIQFAAPASGGIAKLAT